MEGKLPALLGHYDRQTDRPTDQLTDRWTEVRVSKIAQNMGIIFILGAGPPPALIAINYD